MKIHNKNNIKALLFITIIGVYIFNSQSCASTKAGPTGGAKDTIPPIILNTIPEFNATNFPINKGNLILTFDEYVQLKEQYTEIIVSPPSKQKPQTRIKKKSIVVSFKDTLKNDQTYTIYFGNSISDVNESNPFNNYTFTFSTGEKIDSLLFSGTVMDYSTLLPIKGATIMLYENPKDSSVIKELPIAVAKSDEWGYYCVRGLKKSSYTVYAIEDKNYNFLYDRGSELVGFYDTTYTPQIAYNPELIQVQRLEMEDTIKCLSRPSEIDIYMFKEISNHQYLKSYGRISERECYLTFNAKEPQIDTFLIKGIFNDKIIKQFNDEGDSLTFWINDQKKIADTLFLKLSYLKTDSTGTLIPSTENLKLPIPFDKSKIKKKQTNLPTRSYAESLGGVDPLNPGRNRNRNRDMNQTEEAKTGENKEEIVREDLLKMQIIANGESVENKGIELKFPTPLIKILRDSIKFTTSTPRKVKSNVEFVLEKDSTDHLKYVIWSKEEYKVGNEYELYIPTATFTDINNFTNDSIIKNFSLPINDKLSSITLDIKNNNGNKYIVELVNEKRDNVFLKYIIEEDKILLFPYLQAGNYSFRITEDKNKNGKLDIGSVLDRKQPEKARLLKLSDDKVIIMLKEQMDLTQEVDIESLFK